MHASFDDLDKAAIIRAADHYALLLVERPEWLSELGIPNFRAYLTRLLPDDDSPLDVFHSPTGNRVFRASIASVDELKAGYRLLSRIPVPAAIAERLAVSETLLHQMMRVTTASEPVEDTSMEADSEPLRDSRMLRQAQTHLPNMPSSRGSEAPTTYLAEALAQYRRLGKRL